MDMPISNGAVLSHTEAIYRPGDRDLAVAFFEALGCKTYDTGTPSLSGKSYVSVHPDPGQRGLDHVIYLSEMTAQQQQLEQVLRARTEQDAELASARDQYRELAGDKPYGLSHIAVRYPDYASLESVLEGLEERLTPEIRQRSIVRIFRPGDSADITWESVQAFVYTDIAVAGICLFGQIYELSAYGAFPGAEAG
ncbi:MAG: hypothetical protein AB7F98_10100 [Novosphingobium sp.]